MTAMAGEMRTFRVEVGEEDLTQLRDRLRATHWPDPETVEDWSQGVPLAYLDELCRYWAEEYDWRRAEAGLNAFPQVLTEIDGLDIHALHVRSPEPEALPLIITHGWPGSVVEFLKVIGPLTDPVGHGGDATDAFHVVCPSLPGYGFSGKPATAGWGVGRIASAWSELMVRLGYTRYGAQGGDWGSAVATALARQDPDHLAGIHLNMPVVPFGSIDMTDMTPRERAAMDSLAEYQRQESGYAKQQSTRPQTLGYAVGRLAGSPVCLDRGEVRGLDRR